MGVTNRDASWLTQKRRGVALNGYYQSWKANTVNSSNSPGLVFTPPGATGAETLTNAHLGECVCYTYNNALVQQGNTSSGQRYDSNQAVYPPNFSSGGASGLTGTS